MKRNRRLLIFGIVIGSLLTLAPVLGVAGTVFGMTKAFSTLGQSGIADPRALAASIGTALVYTAVGLVLLVVGLVVLITSLVLFVRLPKEAPPPLPGRAEGE